MKRALRHLSLALASLVTLAAAPATGSGPNLDRVRLGRRALAGPTISEGPDSRSQANDAFATIRNGIEPGEHFSPGTDRFGTGAFSQGADLGTGGTSPNLITGDSIHVAVTAGGGGGNVASVTWYGAIVSGPHAGKTPPPYVAGANGFFAVPADSCRSGSTGAVVADNFFVDLDDDYFRGGDRLLYFWAATDDTGGFTTDPAGMGTWLPPSVAAAEQATGGLFEISFLPTITWDWGYLARIQADYFGKLEPTPQELANSQQRSCILYSQITNSRRRSGDLNRTSFMYTLDNLGYRGWYDVYDVQGYGNTNNQLGSRASVAQMTGYALVVQDNGRLSSLTMPDGLDLDSEKIDQANWFHTYLAGGSLSEVGVHSLWLIGENSLQEKPGLSLYNTDMGVQLATSCVQRTVPVSPTVQGVDTTFTFAEGFPAHFATPADRFSLPGGCPAARDYDGLAAVNGAAVTHRFVFADTTFAEGAIVMKASANAKWNTVLMSFDWSDIRDLVGGPPPPLPWLLTENVLMNKILSGVLRLECIHQPNPTDSDPDPSATAVPAVSALHQAAPNPFNPTTTIAFDLARPGAVQLRVFDVAGHLLRVLVNGAKPAGRHQVVWDGLDQDGRRVGSGVYFCQFVARDYSATRRMVVLR